MKCQKCGFPYFDQKGKCLFCGEEAPIDARPPSWWGLKGWHSSPRTESVSKESNPNYPKHGASCTCVDCQEKRLGQRQHPSSCKCERCERRRSTEKTTRQRDQKAPQVQKARYSVPCSACGALIVPGQTFCIMCGARLVSCCPRCRATIQPGQRFCVTCGARLL